MAGCDSSPPAEGYQTLSPAEADRIEQARQDRSQAQAAQAQDDSDQTSRAPAGQLQPADDSEVSPFVLAAAQMAADVVRQSDDNGGGAEASSESTADPWVTSQVAAAGQNRGADPISSAPAAAAPRQPETPLAMAAARAASEVQGEPIIRTIQLLVPERSFSVEGPDDAIRISFDDFDLLKVLNMEPVPVDAVDHFPDWLKNLDGKRVRVRGFMYPTFQETDIPAFVLARDNQICCFGRNPKIYDLVEVTLAPGVTTGYIQGRPFDVVGIFHISPEADGDELWQLYQMTDAIVIDE